MSTTAPAYDRTKLAATLAALGGSATEAAPAKDRASVYASIGVVRDGISMEDPAFDPAKDMITLPQLIGLDNMNHDTRRAGSPEFANQQAARNAFLDDLVEQALSTLAPGETRIMAPFYVSIYRKKDDVVADAAVITRQSTNFFA